MSSPFENIFFHTAKFLFHAAPVFPFHGRKFSAFPYLLYIVHYLSGRINTIR
jgi:hypothetical protein